MEEADTLVPIEIKAGQTITRDFFKGLEHWRQLAGAAAGQPWLVYGGEQQQSRRSYNVVPWRQIQQICQTS